MGVENASNLLKLNKGIKRREILEIMGTRTIQTYKIINDEPSALEGVDYWKDIRISNPYTTEFKKVEDKTLEIVYYYTDKKKIDGPIRDSELTPLISDNGKLMGWGWDLFYISGCSTNDDLLIEEGWIQKFWAEENAHFFINPLSQVKWHDEKILDYSPGNFTFPPPAGYKIMQYSKKIDKQLNPNNYSG